MARDITGIVRNPDFITTPEALVAAVNAAIRGKDLETITELIASVPELSGMTQGQLDQVLTDAGLDVEFDDVTQSDEIPDPIIGSE